MTRLLIWLLIVFQFQESTTVFAFSRCRPEAKETLQRRLQYQLFDEPNHMRDSSGTFVRKKTNRDVKNIQELNERLHHLQTTLASIKEDSWSANNDSKALEEQVEFLWEVLTQKEIDIHNLKVRVEAANESFNRLKPQLQVMEEMISEQWIQIQQHEQTLQKSPFIKYFLRELHNTVKLGLDFLISNGGSALKLCISEALDYLKRAHVVAKYYHHQLENILHQTIKGQYFTHEVVVFLMVLSLLVISVWCLVLLVS